MKINIYQTNRFSNKIIQDFNGHLKDKLVTILGWAFKKDTNDSRESASIYVSCNLLLAGLNLNIYDPLVSDSRIISDIKALLYEKKLSDEEITEAIDRVNICSNYNVALKGSSSVAILTEWDEFKNYNWNKIFTEMKGVKLYDGRNIIPNADYSIGK